MESKKQNQNKNKQKKKEKQSHRHREQTGGYQKERGLGMMGKMGEGGQVYSEPSLSFYTFMSSV